MCLNLFLRGICTLFNNAAHIQYMTLGKIDLYITTCACWQFVKVFDFWKIIEQLMKLSDTFCDIKSASKEIF